MRPELRTPFNAISGFSEVPLDHTTNEVSETQRTVFPEYIRRGGKHVLSLINGILDLSKVEAEWMEVYLELVSLNE